MVTESAPLLGTYGPAISKDGYYRLEAGWAAPQADSFMLQVLAPSGPFHNTVKGSFTGASRQYTDLVMKPGVGPTPVTQFESIVSAEKGYTLSWTTYAGRYTYSIYRKKIADPFYRRVAKDLKTRSWTDSTAIADINYQYIICMHGWDGAIGLPSAAVQVGPAMQTVQSGASFHNWIQTGKTAGPALPDSAYIVAGRKRFQLAPGGMDRLAMAKLVSAPDRPLPGLLKEARFLMLTDWEGLKRDAHRKMLPAQRLALTDTLQTWVYQNAANLMAQSFLPPEGKSGFPYYVFSREPTWGWGHGGQVFHESLTMLAYAHIHPERAMASQRVFAERQHPDGYINYRTGPYLDETIETNGQPTLSAPWYAWTNWELYRITKDRKFLEEMYRSSVKLFEYILKNRDKDGDGLTEWGGHAVLESVRDGEVAVWDEVADPAELEALDMNCMLVQEARSLSQMAAELGLDGEATRWKQEADKIGRAHV